MKLSAEAKIVLRDYEKEFKGKDEKQIADLLYQACFSTKKKAKSVAKELMIFAAKRNELIKRRKAVNKKKLAAIIKELRALDKVVTLCYIEGGICAEIGIHCANVILKDLLAKVTN